MLTVVPRRHGVTRRQLSEPSAVQSRAAVAPQSRAASDGVRVHTRRASRFVEPWRLLGQCASAAGAGAGRRAGAGAGRRGWSVVTASESSGRAVACFQRPVLGRFGDGPPMEGRSRLLCLKNGKGPLAAGAPSLRREIGLPREAPGAFSLGLPPRPPPRPAPGAPLPWWPASCGQAWQGVSGAGWGRGGRAVCADFAEGPGKGQPTSLRYFHSPLHRVLAASSRHGVLVTHIGLWKWVGEVRRARWQGCDAGRNRIFRVVKKTAAEQALGSEERLRERLPARHLQFSHFFS